MSAAGSAGCASCGGLPADMHLGAEGPLCDRRIAAVTGLPRLPDAPPPVAINDADGTPHTMIYRLSRGPAGISARLAEQDPLPDGGYEFQEFGDHDADPKMLLDWSPCAPTPRRPAASSPGPAQDSGRSATTRAASPTRSPAGSRWSAHPAHRRSSWTVTPSPGTNSASHSRHMKDGNSSRASQTHPTIPDSDNTL
jgi:hypothetical protein